MRNPDQIVLATDFSPASTAAVPIASMLARLFKASVILLHIFQYVPKHRYRVPVEWMVEIIRKDVQSKLAEAKRILNQMGIEAEVVVLEDGIPAQQILTYVQACASPLLVMGTHADGGMERFLLGSTAEEVLRQAQCPVVTVGPHVADTHADFHKILFAADSSEASLAAVPFVAALRQLAGAQLRILHVSADPASGAGEENKQFDSVREALQANGSEEYVTLHGTSISQAIVREAESYSADLLVLGVRRASAFVAHAPPKITFQLIAASPCAVLTVSS